MYPLKLRTAICAKCDGPIYLEVAEPRCTANEPSVHDRFEAAVAAHFDSHLSAAAWGDQDRRGCYTIDEALGTVAAYRWWLATADR